MNKLVQYLSLPMLLFALCLNLTCKKDNPVTPPDNTFAMTVEDASCTEVYLRMTIGSGIASRTVTLKRDTITLFTKTLSASETAITDTTLLPGHSYTYHAQLSNGSAVQAQARTMDTTSHNFVWDAPVLLGDVSSVLFDIGIINDTLAYVAGEIHQGGFVYNLAKWDGQTWQVLQIQFYTICGQQNRTPYPASTVYTFSERDIWIGMNGDQVVRFDGSAQTTTMCMPISFSIKRLWGESSSSTYAVGDGGNIVHYNGTSWTKIESGTTLPFQDNWGSGGEVLAVASAVFGLGGIDLVQLSGNGANLLSARTPPAVSMSSVWFVSGRRYFLVGDGIYTKRLLTDSLWRFEPISNQIQNYQYSVRGNGPNDVVVVCEHGTIAHFNGVNWRIYNYPGQTSGDRLMRVGIRNNLVVAVGFRYVDGYHDQGLICVGRR